jgi:glycosyltransferase involved in cell wall biosynthesis
VSSPPRVSIVVPVYNREEFVGETIESLLAQTYDDLQIVVVDDGSTDGSGAVIERLGAAHPGRIVAMRHENAGQAISTNRAFEACDGELLGYLSSDDLLRPDAVATLVEAIERRPDAVVVYPDYLLIDEQGEVIDRMHCGEFDLLEVLRNYDPIIGPGALVRRSAIDRAGAMDPAFPTNVDFEWWLRLILEGPFVWVPEPLASYRRHTGMLSQSARSPEMASLPVKLIDHFYARDDLPEEVLAVRGEAYRSAYMIGAILCTNEDMFKQTRFHIADRRAVEASEAHAAQDPGAQAADRAAALERMRAALEASRRQLADRDERLAQLRERVEAQDATIAAQHQALRGPGPPIGARLRHLAGRARRRLRGAPSS